MASVYIEETGLHSLPLGGSIHTLTLDIPTRRSALSSLSVYFIFELRSKLTRSYGCSSVTASERTEIFEILEFCFENNIILYHLSSYISHKLLLCNVAVFSLLKNAYRDQADRLKRAINIIGRQHFTSLLSLARKTPFTPKKAGFTVSGSFRLIQICP